MIRILFALTWLIVVHPVFAIDTAARISDREIIESLAEIKAGQKALEDKMDQRFIAMQEQMNLRFSTSRNKWMYGLPQSISALKVSTGGSILWKT